MKKVTKRFLCLFLAAALAVFMLPTSLSGDGTDTAQAASLESSGSSASTSDESDPQEESTTIVALTTVDEDGNVISSSVTETTTEDGVTTMETASDDSTSAEEEESAEDDTAADDETSAEDDTTTGDDTSAEDDTSSEEITYTIIFDKNNSDAEGSMDSVTVSVDAESYTLPDCTYTLTGYVLAGWNTSADGTGTSYEPGAALTEALAAAGESVTLYAQWEEDTYEITTTYELTITAKTSAASSSNSALKKVQISVPKLTTTTTKTYSSGDTVSASKTTTYGLTVKVHVRNNGWKKASKNSAGTYYTYTASKASSGDYIQAIRITPSGNLKTAMSKAGLTFVYRAKTAYFGTMGWARPGYAAGSTGNSNPMTGLTLKVISSDDLSSYSTEYRYISKTSVQYKTKYTKSSVWSSAKQNGSTSGKTTSGASIGSLAVKLVKGSSAVSGSIKYSVRTSTSDKSANWSSWKSNYSTAGSKNSKLRAIKIKLTGDMADYYDVYYRVYVNGYGWLGWAKNGEKAGTSGASYNISAVQVKLVAKGASAPGSTGSHFISTSSSTKLKMMVRAQKYSSTSKYLILVDRSAKKVGIFTGKKGNWKLKYYWSCCVGKASTPTISGSYTVGIKLYSFGESKGYSCYYATQISGNYLFHSVLYYPYTKTIKDGTMGKAVSHGCVRLTLSHAKWIYNNIPKGTKINIY